MLDGGEHGAGKQTQRAQQLKGQPEGQGDKTSKRGGVV